MKIETILTPAELSALARRDLSGTACVVFDILRATSTFVTALHHGASAIIPVSEIAEAVALKKSGQFPIKNGEIIRTPPQPALSPGGGEGGQRPGEGVAGQSTSDYCEMASEVILLAGERDGVRIRAAQSGGVDFDFGNSPREFTPERVRGKTIVSTTTNGTRALRACADARTVLAASFLNLTATAEFLRGEPDLLLICAGTGENPASEDIIAAGALVEALASGKSTHVHKCANSIAARTAYVRAMLSNLTQAIGSSQNGQRLLAIPELRDDVAFCAQRDLFNLVAVMDANGSLRRR
jgi:2-phosphosulfolactate phosphatase